MSATNEPQPAGLTFGGVTPILRVQNVATAVDYYINTLGFKIDFHEPGIIASVSRDRCGIFLIEGDQGNPGSWVWIGVSDVDALHEVYRRRGAMIRQPPTNFSWACEMQIQDPDGNVLRMGSEPKEDVPFGPWLDMHGRRWMPREDGRWISFDAE